MNERTGRESLEARLDRLEEQNRFLMDYIAIWKLQSLYCHYINIGANKVLSASSPTARRSRLN